MRVGVILFFLVVALLIAALPSWPYSRRWGYWPSCFFGTLLIALILLLAFGWL